MPTLLTWLAASMRLSAARGMYPAWQLAHIWCQLQVTQEDIYRVMPLCLRHRLRKDPLETIDSGEKVQENFKVGAVPVSPASQGCHRRCMA